MRAIDIQNYKKCLDCDHSYDDDAALYCELAQCNYKKINYGFEMTSSNDIDKTKC